MQILYKQNEWMETKKEGREAGFLTEYDNEAKTGMERLLNIKILSKAIEQNKNKRGRNEKLRFCYSTFCI